MLEVELSELIVETCIQEIYPAVEVKAAETSAGFCGCLHSILQKSSLLGLTVHFELLSLET